MLPRLATPLKYKHNNPIIKIGNRLTERIEKEMRRGKEFRVWKHATLATVPEERFFKAAERFKEVVLHGALTHQNLVCDLEHYLENWIRRVGNAEQGERRPAVRPGVTTLLRVHHVCPHKYPVVVTRRLHFLDTNCSPPFSRYFINVRVNKVDYIATILINFANSNFCNI